MIRPRILMISGSLRVRSSNTELLLAAASIAEPVADVLLYRGIEKLPHFNPDLDEEGAVLPSSVQEFRADIAASQAILISSPEYAHGVPGSLKNALDWLVSGPEMPGKPTGLVNVSARSVHAHAALEETLRTMSAHLVPEAVTVIQLDGRRLDARAITADPLLAAMIRNVIDALVAASPIE